jgi:membrane protease YdiL (CAAX protease family)
MIKPEMLFLIVLGLSVLAIPIMWRMRLLSLPASGKEGSGLALMTPLIGFLLFLSTCAYVPKWVEKLMLYTDMHGLSAFSKLEMQSFPQLVALVVSCILLLGFSKIHAQEAKSQIWGQKEGFKAALGFLGKGALYCLLTYPVVMAVVQSIHYAVVALGFEATEEQLSLVQLRALRAVPWLFWSMAGVIITIVPILEELLFRGFLQNFFQGLVGLPAAIIGASALFALFHYAPEQCSSNIELMTGLFLYAYFMGTFYARTRSLWVSIGMHATFNGLSIVLMIYM